VNPGPPQGCIFFAGFPLNPKFATEPAVSSGELRIWEAGLDRQRIDKWLWHARIVRSRADAAELVARGHVRLNGLRQTSPGHAVKTGDVLTIALDTRVRILKVAGFAERRGDAQTAYALYEDLQPRTQ